jgi:transposase, IS5 family
MRSAAAGGQEVRQTGRRGLPAESVLRCALLKQQRQLCYEELAFHLEDSASFRAVARLPLAWSPKKSMLHHTIAAIRAEPGRQSTRRCWPVPKKTGWKAAQ